MYIIKRKIDIFCVQLPVQNRLVIPMDSSDEEGEPSTSTSSAFSLGGIDRFLKDARKSVEVSMTPNSGAGATSFVPKTPVVPDHLCC